MSIQADGQTWTVKRTTEPIGGDSGERSFLGKSNEAENMIVIDGTMPESRQEEVLIHELVHVKNRDLPEFIVADVGIGMYGVLKENGLLVDGLLDTVSDGDLTPDETARINRESNEMAEDPELMFMREKVSEKPWDGPVFGEDGALTIAEASGAVNRTAAHLAVATIARGAAPAGKLRQAARDLRKVYRDTLKEPVPQALDYWLR